MNYITPKETEDYKAFSEPLIKRYCELLEEYFILIDRYKIEVVKAKRPISHLKDMVNAAQMIMKVLDKLSAMKFVISSNFALNYLLERGAVLTSPNTLDVGHLTPFIVKPTITSVSHITL